MRALHSKMAKYGLFVAGTYLALTLVVVVYASICKGMYCGLVIVLPVLPEVFLLEGLVADSVAAYFFFVAVNAILLYLATNYFIRYVSKRKKEDDDASKKDIEFAVPETDD